jgi:hypothetical protein
MQQADVGAGGVIMTDHAGGATAAGNINRAAGAAAVATPLPKCFCNWKHCRTYQKAFREFQHPFFNGVIKLKFVKNDRKSLALKATVDRTLHVDSSKRNEWRDAEGEVLCRYYVARHHFTEALIKTYLSDRRAWDWNEPLSMKQAKNFLWSLDRQDVYHSEDEAEEDDDDDPPTRYVQAPNVPKDQVREMLKKLKEESKKQAAAAAAAAAASQPADDEQELPPKGKNGVINNKAGGASGHTQSTLSTSITDTLKAFEEDIIGHKESANNNGQDVALAQKEEENIRLRQELNECQEQLSMLHNMVKQLKVDMDRTNNQGGGKAKAANKKKKKKKEEFSSEEEDY